MKNRVIMLLLALLPLSACEEILNVEPKQSIDADSALTSKEAVSAATNGVYARLRSVSLYGRDLIAIPELLADNAINTGAGNRLIQQGLNQAGFHLSNWQVSYYAINQINLILEALQTLEADEAYKRQIKGQVLFLRGLIYHNLLRVYAYDPTAIVTAEDRGGVPLLTKGVTAVDDIQYDGRQSIAEGYSMVYDDLQQAYQLLEGTPRGRAPHFATQGAVAALLSRVALYNGDYELAIKEADKAMQSGVATLANQSQVESSWRSEVHPESFFEVVFAAPDNVGSNESLRATFMTRTNITSTNPASHGNVVLSEDLYESYEEGDLRKALVMRGLAANANAYEITKFASKNGGIPNLDNVPVIRYAEVVLNKAEALAHLNKDDLARDEVNKIRERSGLSPTSLAGQELLDEIIHQRRIEFAFEGHRFFDLKRLGRDIQKEFGVIHFTDFRILARIPTREVDVNPNLVQNRGY